MGAFISRDHDPWDPEKDYRLTPTNFALIMIMTSATIFVFTMLLFKRFVDWVDDYDLGELQAELLATRRMGGTMNKRKSSSKTSILKSNMSQSSKDHKFNNNVDKTKNFNANTNSTGNLKSYSVNPSENDLIQTRTDSEIQKPRLSSPVDEFKDTKKRIEQLNRWNIGGVTGEIVQKETEEIWKEKLVSDIANEKKSGSDSGTINNNDVAIMDHHSHSEDEDSVEVVDIVDGRSNLNSNDINDTDRDGNDNVFIRNLNHGAIESGPDSIEIE